MSAAALAEAFHVEDEAEAEAADSGGTCVSLCEWYVLICGDICWTHMQKKGEIRDERARERTEK